MSITPQVETILDNDRSDRSGACAERLARVAVGVVGAG